MPLDLDEPRRLAEAIKKLGLKHAVITSVTRDDLDDQGASHFANCIHEIRALNPEVSIEVLTPDFSGDIRLIKKVVEDYGDKKTRLVRDSGSMVENSFGQVTYNRSNNMIEFNKIKIENDIKEVGKAIGAIKAAHITLMVKAGLKYEDLRYSYMSGASGTYVNANKARHIGLVPGFSKGIIQFGNTSIGLARKLAIDSSRLEEVNKIAKKVTADHLMMATSETFKNIYVCELATWIEGMSDEMYNEVLIEEGIPIPPEDLPRSEVEFERRVKKDIDDVGELGLDIVDNVGIVLEAPVEKCILCHKCEEECPEDAITIVENEGDRFANINSQACLGSACKRCVYICPVKTIDHRLLKIQCNENVKICDENEN